jgi:hypothetical protein
MISMSRFQWAQWMNRSNTKPGCLPGILTFGGNRICRPKSIQRSVFGSQHLQDVLSQSPTSTAQTSTCQSIDSSHGFSGFFAIMNPCFCGSWFWDPPNWCRFSRAEDLIWMMALCSARWGTRQCPGDCQTPPFLDVDKAWIWRWYLFDSLGLGYKYAWDVLSVFLTNRPNYLVWQALFDHMVMCQDMSKPMIPYGTWTLMNPRHPRCQAPEALSTSKTSGKCSFGNASREKAQRLTMSGASAARRGIGLG